MSPRPDAGWKLALAELFEKNYKPGALKVEFTAAELHAAAHKYRVRNQYDIVYNSRSRAQSVPRSAREKCPPGFRWVIKTQEKGIWEFIAVPEAELVAFGHNPLLVETKILNATPEIIAKYAKQDEQAALAIVRYNRLVDVFTGVTAYSLQSHLKTEAKGMAQVEVDELYLGVDSMGRHYAIPVEAKSGSDTLNALQIQQNIRLCKLQFPELIARPLGVKFIKREGKNGQGSNVIAMMEFQESEDGLRLLAERHYKLVSKHELTDADLTKQNAVPAESAG